MKRHFKIREMSRTHMNSIKKNPAFGPVFGTILSYYSKINTTWNNLVFFCFMNNAIYVFYWEKYPTLYLEIIWKLILSLSKLIYSSTSDANFFAAFVTLIFNRNKLIFNKNYLILNHGIKNFYLTISITMKYIIHYNKIK